MTNHHLADEFGHLKIFDFIFAKVGEHADEFGDSPLHYAATFGHL